MIVRPTFNWREICKNVMIKTDSLERIHGDVGKINLMLSLQYLPILRWSFKFAGRNNDYNRRWQHRTFLDAAISCIWSSVSKWNDWKLDLSQHFPFSNTVLNPTSFWSAFSTVPGGTVFPCITRTPSMCDRKRDTMS